MEMYVMNKKSKKLMAWMITFLMIFSCGIFTTTAWAEEVSVSDIQGHWAEKQVNDWVENGLVKGYKDGTFKPNNPITRAEFVTLINGAIGTINEADIHFSDVKKEDWFNNQIAKAVEAGYISGYEDNTMRPNKKISRQEAAIVISNILNLEKPEDIYNLNKFKDGGHIANWCKYAVSAVVKDGYMGGYPNETFKPTNPITRAESIAMLDSVIGLLYNQPGTYGPETGINTIEGNVTIASPDITFKNTEIKGMLYLAEGIGEGEVTLDNVTVLGKTLIKGGGENSLTFTNSNLGDVIVVKVNGKVRVIATGDTNIGDLSVGGAGAILKELEIKGVGFENVQVLGTIEEGGSLILEGDFEDVSVEANVDVKATGDTKIDQLTITESAQGATVDLEEGTSVGTMTLDAPTTVTGEGSIEIAQVNTNDVTIEQTPKTTEVPDGVTTTVGGEEITETTTQPESSGGGGGGGGSSSDTTAPTLTNISLENATLQENGTEIVFIVERDKKYKDGSASLSEKSTVTASNSNYTIKDQKIDKGVIPIVDVLDILSTLGGSEGDVKGEKLINNSPVTIKLTDMNENSRTYTLKFQS